MPNLHPNSTNYIHSYEPNTNDLTMAMDYNALGQPVLRAAFAQTQMDAFGRFRTSDPFTLFDSTLRYGDDTRTWDTKVYGAGSATHLINESTMSMQVGTSIGDSVIRETKRVFIYQPGKSQLSLNTFVFDEGKPGLRQRVGLFGERNGVFVERDGLTTYIVKRSYISGTANDVRIAQEDWNTDRLDGTGNSTVNIDWSKVQIFWTDIEWLGAGTIRVGFVINGQFRVAHCFHHANIIDSVYMTSATLPIRYEIENVSATESSSRLKHICNSVISEGGSTPRVTPRSVSTPLTGINLSNTFFTPVIALRLKTTHIDGVVAPANINLYGLQNTAYRYALYNDVTLTGGTWISDSNESHVEYNITSTAFSEGKKMVEGIFVGGAISGSTDVLLKNFDSALQLTRKIGSIPEILLLAVQSTTNNDDCVASMIWEEYN